MTRGNHFRAWDYQLKKFHYFDGIFNSRPYTETSAFSQYDSCKKYHDLTVQEYSDTKDIHDKFVCEGDAVMVMREDSFRPYLAEVYFSYDCFGTAWWNPLEKRYDFEPLYSWDVKIMGNNFENPELWANK
jgi:hypothetical protein